MYSSTQSFTLTCVAGEVGESYAASATATSIISQTDANAKALGMAKTLAYEYIQCSFAPGPTTVLYYSAEVSASADSDPGYQTETFTYTLPAGSVYSAVSQAAADAQAQVVAQVAANEKRDAEQVPIFYNQAQVWSGACPGGLGDGYTVTITIAAGTITSNLSESDASQDALAEAKSQVAALLVTNCIPTFLSTTQTYTANCTPPLVGAPVTVTNPPGTHSSTVSQAEADALSLAAAQEAAEAQLVCGSGWWNEQQSYTATCEGEFGPNWYGTDSSYTVYAGTYFSTVSQADANAIALGNAMGQALAGLSCNWGGGFPGP